MKLREYALVMYKNQPALIKTVTADKFDIDTPSGTKKVRDKDITLLHAGPVANLSKVQNYPLPEADVREAHTFFDGDNPSLRDIADLLWGDLPPEAWWSVWKTVSESPWFIAESPESPIALRPESQAQAIIAKAQAKKEEGTEKDAFLERLASSLKTGTAFDIASDGKYLQEVEALALGKTDKSRILKELQGKVKTAETPEAAHEILLATGYWKPSYNPWPSRHGHTIRSSQVPVDPPTDKKERLDLTHYESWAIDNAWSTDPDDAVCFDGERLWIHVADPAETVAPDTPADRDARSRGATLYIPEGAARMLCEETLDYYALGLSPVSRALSFSLLLNPNGSIADVSIHRTRVRVSRLTYAEAELRKDEPGLAPLFAIAANNIERRAKAGAISIDLPEVHLQVSKDDQGNPTVSIQRIEPSPAADMVREMMLLAGEGAARFAFKNRIPFQYVSQEAPDIPEQLPPGLAGEYRKRRGMRSRKVGTVPADHAGLGLGMYSQVTSPLRRYGDLVAHQQLHLWLDGKPLMDTDDMLLRIAQGDLAARECTLAERETNLHWTLVYLAMNPSWTAEAVVVDRAGNQAVVFIPELAREAKITLGNSVELGTVITVRAGNIHIPTQTVTFITDAV
ncbi:MAG TPA: RNB domain-containing ribonuclease [Treponemataceae bacterium]|nr:RNB domain-containing ribonuclease [Treponemataceae bacterium]